MCLEVVMNRLAVKHVLLLVLVGTLMGCSRTEPVRRVAVQIGDSESVLTCLDSVASFRSEILRHVKDNWESHGQTETNWIRVYSLTAGDEAEAERALGLEVDEPLGFSSECSTSVFRLRRDHSERYVVEERDDDGGIRIEGNCNSPNWGQLEAIMGGMLNDSILGAVLRNGGQAEQ